MMAKIIAPNKKYTGVSATVPFCNGVGETDDKRLVEWFKSHGYEVEESEKAEPDSNNSLDAPQKAETKPKSTSKGV